MLEVSRTRAHDGPLSWALTTSTNGRSVAGRMLSTSAIVGSTRPGSVIGARPTNQTPSSKTARRRSATSEATRVLPAPGGPVTRRGGRLDQHAYGVDIRSASDEAGEGRHQVVGHGASPAEISTAASRRCVTGSPSARSRIVACPAGSTASRPNNTPRLTGGHFPPSRFRAVVLTIQASPSLIVREGQ